jgi:hypothetical protein
MNEYFSSGKWRIGCLVHGCSYARESAVFLFRLPWSCRQHIASKGCYVPEECSRQIHANPANTINLCCGIYMYNFRCVEYKQRNTALLVAEITLWLKKTNLRVLSSRVVPCPSDRGLHENSITRRISFLPTTKSLISPSWSCEETFVGISGFLPLVCVHVGVTCVI